MFDKIEKKVQEVRKQPEHVRIRWVWGSVIAAMIFVVFIWMMSMRISFLQVNSDTQTKESLSNFQDQMGDFATSPMQEESISIDDLLESGALEQGM